MKELDIFFDKVEAIIDETYKLNEHPKFSHFGIVRKWILRGCINTMRTIIRLNLEFKNTRGGQSLKNKTASLNATIITDTNGIVCKEILIKYLFGKASKLETKICKEAMKEIKVIASDLMYNASNVAPLLIQESLFSMPEIDRNAYTELISHELDGRLTAIYENINHLDGNGWDSSYLTRDISSYLTHVFSTFALFNIDLTPIIKYNSDFEKRFGTYDKFRDEKFASSANKSELLENEDNSDKEENPEEPCSYKYNEEKISQIYNFCNEDAFAIEFNEFIKAISTTDFSTIYNSPSTKKAKLAYSISIIKDFVNSTIWYKKAAESIGSSPTKCSGANVKSWSDKINDAIK